MHALDTRHQKGTRRTRIGRQSIVHQIYHVIASTSDRKPEFLDFGTARQVTRSLASSDNDGITTTLAFVVMPDHLHWLMQLHASKCLPVCIGRMKSLSAKLIHSHSESSGSIWQRGYFDRAIRREEDLVAISRYIVANPIRAGLVGSIGQYPHWDAVWMDCPT